MKSSRRSYLAVLVLGLLASGLAQAAGLSGPQYAMPSLFGGDPITPAGEITISYWMTFLFTLSLCAVPFAIVIRELRAEQRAHRIHPDITNEPGLEDPNQLQKAA